MPSRHYGEFELLDYSESKSSFSFNFGAITALSLPGFLTQFGALRTALQNITIGTVRRERWTGDETVLSSIPPIDSNAQRELFWWVIYEGATTNRGSHSCQIATPNLSLLGVGGHEVDYSAPAIAAFITAFEAIARDPDNDTEAVVVTDILFKGRNN